MAPRSKIKWGLLLIFCVVLVAIGSYFLIYGAFEIYHVQNNISDERTVHLNPTKVIPFLDDPYANKTVSTFKTNDVFAVNNNLTGEIKIYMKNSNIMKNSSLIKNSITIDQIDGIMLTRQDTKMSWANGTDKQVTDSLNNLGSVGDLALGSPTPNEKNVYSIYFKLTPSSEEDQSVWIFLHRSNNTWWHYYIPMNLPTIEPANSLTQIKNNRIIEGLTWVIIGMVPIGLVAEFWIEYLIENHFYRKEKSNINSEYSINFFLDTR